MPATVAAGPWAGSSRPTVGSAWAEALRQTIRRPGILLPFALLAALELYALLLIVEAPAFFARWLNPFIARQYGPPYVEFPVKTAVLPSLFWGARVLMEIFLGGLLSAWVARRVFFLVRREPQGLGGALRAVLPRVASFAAVSLVVVLLGRAASVGIHVLFTLHRGGAPVFPPPWGPALFIAAQIAAVSLIGALFIFTVPMMASGASLARAMAGSARRFFRHPLQAAALVAIPGIPYFLLSAAAALAPGFAGVRSPEPVVALLAAGIAAAFVARLMMTAGASALLALDESN